MTPIPNEDDSGSQIMENSQEMNEQIPHPNEPDEHLDPRIESELMEYNDIEVDQHSKS